MKYAYENLSLVDLPEEDWVDAYGFDGIYEVSNLGRIKSIGRWVSNGKSERWVKERIRKQVLVSDGRLTCPFNVNNKHYSINVSVLIFQSFNLEISWDKSTHCIMHKDKIKRNNSLSNLKLATISESHSINFKKGLLPHLKINNEKLKNYVASLETKTCSVCGKEKDINKFPKKGSRCQACKSERAKLAPSYINKRKKKDNRGY